MLKQLLQNGESEKLEFKTSFGREAIETLVAFANAQGGRLLIGVKDSGEVMGVSASIESPQQWINQVKSSTASSVVPDVEVLEYEGKDVVILTVPRIVLNMIVHRDYRSSSDSTIKIFNDRIEFFNPGTLSDGISLDEILSGSSPSISRNKQIASIFKEAGIKRVREAMYEADAHAPVFYQTTQDLRKKY